MGRPRPAPCRVRKAQTGARTLDENHSQPNARSSPFDTRESRQVSSIEDTPAVRWLFGVTPVSRRVDQQRATGMAPNGAAIRTDVRSGAGVCSGLRPSELEPPPFTTRRRRVGDDTLVGACWTKSVGCQIFFRYLTESGSRCILGVEHRRARVLPPFTGSWRLQRWLERTG